MLRVFNYKRIFKAVVSSLDPYYDEIDGHWRGQESHECISDEDGHIDHELHPTFSLLLHQHPHHLETGNSRRCQHLSVTLARGH